MKNLKARNMIYNAKENLTRFSDFLSRAAFGAAITAGGLIQHAGTAEEAGQEIVERVNNFKTVLLSLVAAGGVIYLIISCKSIEKHLKLSYLKCRLRFDNNTLICKHVKNVLALHIHIL